MTTHELELVGRVRMTATLRVVSGLHIGAGNETIEIGGIDNPVVKTPKGDPYVPGSSVKGKLRFLLEWAFGKVNQSSGKPWGMDGSEEFQVDDPILRIFGTPAGAEAWRAGPTRLLVRDANALESWRDKALDSGWRTEAKTEVSINRIAGKALDGGLRTTERVPVDAQFKFEAVFRLYGVDGDGGARDRDCLGWTIQGLDLLEQDALGGSGSRGYGRIRFENLALAGAGGDRVELDNVFRGHPFSRTAPPPPIMEKIEAVTRSG